MPAAKRASNKENARGALAKRRRRGNGAACSSCPVTTHPVKVVVRLRPLLGAEAADAAAAAAADDEFASYSIRCVGGGGGGRGAPSVLVQKPYCDEKHFRFSDVIGPNATQQDVFDRVGGDAMVCQVLDGINSTVLCYGQTGAGKTHTIFGADDAAVAPPSGGTLSPHCGLVPRLVAELFTRVDAQAQRGARIEVKVAFLQIYNETLRDLLADDPDASRPIIREREAASAAAAGGASKGSGATVFVEGAELVPVESARTALQIIAAAAACRYSAETQMNKTSSRSHAVIQIFVEQQHKSGAAGGAMKRDAASGCEVVRTTRAVLTVVDLAGSERVGRSGSAGARLAEACHINKSISALGNCIAALADAASARAGARTHVPFRDSTLTRLLTNTLGGNSKTVICANVSPLARSVEETNSTLLFARRAMRVKNRVAQNEVVELAPVVAARASGAPAPAAAAAASAAGPSGRAGEGSKSALKAEMTLLFTENRRAFAENVSLRSENAALRAALKEAQRSARAAQREECAPAEGADHQLWEQREHQLVSEFSTLIDSLKCEIARQNEYIATLRQPSNALKQASASLLSIPEIRAFISQRLGNEADDLSAAARPATAASRASTSAAVGGAEPMRTRF